MWDVGTWTTPIVRSRVGAWLPPLHLVSGTQCLVLLTRVRSGRRIWNVAPGSRSSSQPGEQLAQLRRNIRKFVRKCFTAQDRLPKG